MRNLSFFKSHVNDMEGKNPHVLLAPTIDDPSPRAFNAKVYLSSRLYVKVICGYALGIYPESRLSQLAVFAAHSGRDLM
mgnify:CR=1 FL=1